MKKYESDVAIDPRNIAVETVSLLRVERGIAYFEGGYWMHDSDRHELNNNKRKVRPKVNKETKQVEIDYTIVPSRSDFEEMMQNKSTWRGESL